VSGGVHASLLPGLFSSSVDLEASLKERGILFLGNGTGLRVQPTAEEKAGDPWTGRSKEGKWQNSVAWLMVLESLSRIQRTQVVIRTGHCCPHYACSRLSLVKQAGWWLPLCQVLVLGLTWAGGQRKETFNPTQSALRRVY